MLDHIGLGVSDFERAKAFYQTALAPLEISIIMEFSSGEATADAYCGFGKDDKPFFWIGAGQPPRGSLHVAFLASDRPTVDRFHAAAIAAGGRDNGAPGLRPHYHADYYGAFVLDPDGHNIEAVCHRRVP